MQSVESWHRLEKICTEREGQENDHMSWNLTSGHNTCEILYYTFKTFKSAPFTETAMQNSVLFCLEGPGFDPRPRQISSAPFLRRASPGCDTLTSRKSWQISVTQLLGGTIMELQTLATSVVLLSVRPTPRTI